MLAEKYRIYALPLIVLIAAAIFVPFIGNCPLFDWDEVNFAECAREMLASSDYSHVQLNYRPFWEKPPFFIWMQALSMNLFGVNEFAARFPNALCSIATFITLYYAGKRFHSPGFGVLWCVLYGGCLLPHLYFKSGLIDPWFNLFIFLSLYNLLFVVNNPEGRTEWLHAVLAGLFLGLAVLTKGPAALLIVFLTLAVASLWAGQLRWMRSVKFIFFLVTTLLVAGSWFFIEWLKGNGDIIVAFVNYQKRLFETGDAGHDGPWFYHIAVLLLGCFPASLLFIISYLKYKGLTPFQRLFRRLMLALFWVVLIVFSIVKTKIVHYSSLCYFPVSFVAAVGLQAFFAELKWSGLVRALYWVLTVLIAFAIAAITFIENFKHKVITTGWIKDEFAVQNLSTSVKWNGFEWLIVFIFIAGAMLVYNGVERQNVRRLYYGLACQLVFIWVAIAVIIPKVEQYTQHSAIVFYKSCAKQHCYVETHGFKSYAYLFYSERKPDDYVNADQNRFIENQLDVMETEGHSRLSSFATANLLWMENGKIDRPAYIVVKTPDEDGLLRSQGMHKLYDENGYSFFVRMPVR
jgi:4-amino-4-deoxy-L-arabinose transferase-like glycosyltransferase